MLLRSCSDARSPWRANCLILGNVATDEAALASLDRLREHKVSQILFVGYRAFGFANVPLAHRY
jgi:hypothetical protein